MQMKLNFASIRFDLLVGIGGGAPSAGSDISLGNVVISQPYAQHGGVVQYDLGEDWSGRTSYTDGVAQHNANCSAKRTFKVAIDHYRGGSSLPTYLSVFDRLPSFSREKAGPDILFKPTYDYT